MTEAEKPLDSLAGTIIADKYRLLSLLGSGGMGSVYQAEQLGLGRSVAVKLLRRYLVVTRAEWFRAEAMAASRINHPHAVSIYDYGVTPAGVPYLVMEHLRGQTLAALIEAEPLSPDRIISIAAQVLSALAEAHACGIVHCDLTSDNVIVDRLRDGDDFAKVIDFGLVRLCEKPPGQGPVIGTAEYMAPEQIRGDQVTPATDLYAVGVLLYEMIVGRTPFAGASIPVILEGHLRGEPHPPHDIIPTCPPALAQLTLCALSKAPENRPLGAADLRERLLALRDARPGALHTCRRCGEATTASRFCSHCGAVLSDVAAPACGGAATAPPHAPGTTNRPGPPRPRAPVRRSTRLTFEIGGPGRPLIGRERELARILDFASGRGGPLTLAVVGPPGVGKARLLVETSRIAGGDLRCVLAAADPSGLRTPWYPMLSLLEQALDLPAHPGQLHLSRAVARCGLSQRDVPGLAEIFGAGDTMHDLEPEVRRREAEAAGLRALLSIPRRSPRVLFCLADVDRYDAPSARLVRALAEKMGDGARLLVTAEDRSAAPPGAEILLLGGLPPQCARDLALALSGTAAALPTALALHSLTEGSPAAIEQLAGWIATGNSPAHAPTMLVDLITLRINRLPPAARRLLQAVAIHGTVASRAVVEEMLRDPALVAQAAPGWPGLLVIEATELTIPTALVASVIHACTPADVRRDLHARALVALGEAAPLGVRAHHAAGAGELDRAFHDFLEAGRDAARRFDDPGAIVWFGRALSAGRALAARGRAEAGVQCIGASLELAEALRRCGECALAGGVLDETGMFAPELHDAALIALARGKIALAGTAPRQAAGHLRLAIGAALRTGDRITLCEAYMELARALERAGLPDQALAELNQGLDMLTQGEDPRTAAVPDNFWRLCIDLAERLLRDRRTEEAAHITRAAVAQSQRTRSTRARARSLALLARIEEELGDRPAACAHRAEAIEALRLLGDRRATAELLFLSAPASQDTLHLAEALAEEIGWNEGLRRDRAP